MPTAAALSRLEVVGILEKVHAATGYLPTGAECKDAGYRGSHERFKRIRDHWSKDRDDIQKRPGTFQMEASRRRIEERTSPVHHQEGHAPKQESIEPKPLLTPSEILFREALSAERRLRLIWNDMRYYPSVRMSNLFREGRA